MRVFAATAAAILMTASLHGSTENFKPAIPDVPVLTQDGKSVRFYSDLVKGKTLAVNFVFTNCKTICPMLGGPGIREKSYSFSICQRITPGLPAGRCVIR